METSIKSILGLLDKWAAKGKRLLPDGTKLFSPATHVSPQAWLHKIYAGLSDSEIEGYEKKFPLPFPSEYREFLHYANGISLFSNSLSVWGWRAKSGRVRNGAIQPYDLSDNNYERPKGCPNTWLFFGSYSGDGSRLLFDLSEKSENHNKVFRCAKRSTEILEEWPSFREFLLSEIGRLDKLYDKNGVKIEMNAPTTPN